MRAQNALKNFAFGYLNKFIGLFFTIALTPAIYHILGKELFGLNALVFQALTYLSLAELGIGTSLMVALYQPLANREFDLLNRILATGQRLYRYVALLIFVIGMVICFFFDSIFIVSDESTMIARIVFSIYLLKTVMTYCFAAYYGLLSAAQLGYKIGWFNIVSGPFIPLFNFVILSLGLGLIGMAVFNFSLALLIQFLTIRIVRKHFAWLDLSVKGNYFFPFLSNLFPVFINSLLTVVVFQTDYILISSLLGVSFVAAYAVYNNLFVLLREFIWLSLRDLTHGIGELYAQHRVDAIYQLWRDIFGFIFLIGTIGLPLVLLFTDRFIEFWMGQTVVLGFSITSMFTLNLLYVATVHCSTIFITAQNYFWKRLPGTISELSINLILSIFLIPKFGVLGAVLGTCIGHWLVNSWFIPKLFLHSVGRPLSLYVRIFFQYSSLLCINTGVVFLVHFYFLKSLEGLSGFALQVSCGFAVSALCSFVLFYFLDSNFPSLRRRLVGIVRVIPCAKFSNE